MTSDSTLFSTQHPVHHSPTIHTADGSPMSVNHIGNISTSHTTLQDTYFIPQLTLNLISVGQLCELGLTVVFSSFGCCVQDPKTGQTLGIGRKIGRLFELISLYIPSHLPPPIPIAACTTCTPTLNSWHNHLVHASTSRLQILVSSGQLGPVKNTHLDCLSYQLTKQSALPFN